MKALPAHTVTQQRGEEGARTQLRQVLFANPNQNTPSVPPGTGPKHLLGCPAGGKPGGHPVSQLGLRGNLVSERPRVQTGAGGGAGGEGPEVWVRDPMIPLWTAGPAHRQSEETAPPPNQ